MQCVTACIADSRRRNIEFGDEYCDPELVVDACFSACEGAPNHGWWEETCDGNVVDFSEAVIRCIDTAICGIEVPCHGVEQVPLPKVPGCP